MTGLAGMRSGAGDDAYANSGLANQSELSIPMSERKAPKCAKSPSPMPQGYYSQIDSICHFRPLFPVEQIKAHGGAAKWRPTILFQCSREVMHLCARQQLYLRC